ncbi:putative RNA-directed DNA polymerase from transposon X-element [Araneus ventricosus]|uniref:Putative RNA-directed DNA polymerase from transposon X-element n=1 Tax=Araneus ventricosus TaxID=182803 RepID=A0A4Y2KWA8_ARAVE|nr:putative RNA-directed DNA polymerase from transposon X-element [Araneus ventricosus]
MQLGTHCIFGGDFNAHNKAWGSTKTSIRGNRLKQFANAAGLDIIAPPSPTRYGHNSATIIDLALIKNFLYPYDITSIPEMSSDHNPIILNFYFQISTPKNNKTFKTNWNNYQRELCNSTNIPFPKINNTLDIDKQIENLTNDITTAFHNNSKEIPTKTIHINSELKNIYQNRNKARKIWQTTRNPHFKNLYNNLNHKANTLKEKVRQTEIAENLIKMNPVDGTLWNAAKKMRKKHAKISALKGPASIAYSNTDKAELIANSLEKQFQLNDIHNSVTENKVNNTLLDFSQITHFPPLLPPNPIDIIKYTQKINIHKAPGIDGISNKMIRNLPFLTQLRYIHIVNHIFKLLHFPSTWKTAIIIPILKPGKDPSDPTNYRPISLLPTLSKITEHFILIQLNDYLNSKNLLIPFQFGFKPKLSTTHQLLRAVEHITAGFQHKFHTGAVFLDIQKAFDRVWIQGLTYKMINMEIPPPSHQTNKYLPPQQNIQS